MIYNFKNQKGYIALISLLIIVATALTIGLAISLRGVEEIQISFGKSQAVKAENLANACIEEGLERLRNNWSNYSDSLAIGDNSCIINAEVSGSIATLYATGTADIYTQKIEVQVDDSLNVIYWEE